MPESTPFEIADRMVREGAARDPIEATFAGVPGHDHQWPDLGPEALEAERDAAVADRHDLRGHLQHPDADQRLAATVIVDRLDERIAQLDHDDDLADIRHMACSFDGIRSVFDIMDTTTEAGREAVLARLSTMGAVFDGYRRRLLLGVDRGVTAAVRQAESVLAQANDLSGPESAFGALEGRWGDGDRPALAEAIASAKEQVAEFAAFLQERYLPAARTEDGTERDRYVRAAESMLGLRIDPEDAYAWGWDEVNGILDEMRGLASEIVPGASLDAVVELLETDIERAAPDAASLIRFVEQRQIDALENLDGSHFDVPPQGRQVRVELAPPGGALGAYYVPPSEDFSRPGSIWYSIEDPSEPRPLYQEVSTAYHEGFPGHHLQLATSLAASDRLSRYQRLWLWYPGLGEGWALYTERLMEELGYFEKPEYTLGMLVNGLLRAVRVVVDLGMHLGFDLPADAPLDPGEPWTFDRAVRYLSDIALQPAAVARSEVLRYLGWPGQAISYKLGERALLDLRSEFLGRGGDVRDFHRRVLALGDLRLDRLRESVLA